MSSALTIVNWCPGDTCDPCNICTFSPASNFETGRTELPNGLGASRIDYNFGRPNFCQQSIAWPIRDGFAIAEGGGPPLSMTTFQSQVLPGTSWDTSIRFSDFGGTQPKANVSIQYLGTPIHEATILQSP